MQRSHFSKKCELCISILNFLKDRRALLRSLLQTVECKFGKLLYKQQNEKGSCCLRSLGFACRYLCNQHHLCRFKMICEAGVADKLLKHLIPGWVVESGDTIEEAE